MKLTPQKRQAKSIKTRLIWSFAANIVIIFLLFVVYASIRNITINAEQVSTDLSWMTSKIQEVKSDQKSFLLTETINPKFYESKKNRYITSHKEALEAIDERLEKMYVNSYVQDADIIPSLRELEKSLAVYRESFDTLIHVQLERGFKSYGTEGEMRRSIYSVMNSGYDLDQVKILSLRRHEKDYILRKDKRYVSKLVDVLDDLKSDINRTVRDKYGKVFIIGALEKYKTNFLKLVSLDEQLGFYGKTGIKDNLNDQLARVEDQLVNINEVIKEYDQYWKRLNIVVLISFALTILTVNALLLFYLLSRLGKPINLLSKSIQKIVEEDFQGELYTIKTKDELGDLSDDFNFMINKMNERRTEIEEQQVELTETYEKIDQIRQIGSKLSRHLKVEGIIQEFYHSLLNTLDFSSFLIGIHQDGIMHYQGFSASGEKMAFSRNLSESTHLGVQCFERQEPIISNDYMNSNELKHFLPVLTTEKISSLIYLPLISSSSKIGVLAVHSEDVNAFSDVQINMLGSIVVYAVNALDTAINYQNMEELVDRKTVQLHDHRNQLMEKNALLEGALEELEVKNQQQTSSIQYAKRIQQALLPNISLIRSRFDDAFVFYRPKDIVSGDFYWFEEKGDLTYMAVADCTGHGVPGAFMSILGREILSNLINTQEIVSPGKLLDELHVRIRIVLKQDRVNNKDGMDIGMCVINKRTNELKFAGAHHPLYVVKESEEVNTIETIDGNKQSIGGHLFKKKQYEPFKEHVIDLNNSPEILSFYMSSDGYQDQFGGEEGRKFYKKSFRNLMTDIAKKPMYEQKSLIAMKIDEWMGAEHKQTDDILVIGFKPTRPRSTTIDFSSIDEILNV
ncbi:SpoIIE family protein phosphatase [Flammeovirga agarivorans]|uniref:SpoIIE family protein phosphatase n=1 Tax=Flammeovirga agarivorans TaxID=2726742 RepID=A0A7X8XYE1_9BACT|nr:SpoIIE family protein phosphatase [Flammeovirga agarivorans]NLR94141.1 SpoIIE family protein phosphatase [Flammeovirga agarivorans]